MYTFCLLSVVLNFIFKFLHYVLSYLQPITVVCASISEQTSFHVLDTIFLIIVICTVINLFPSKQAWIQVAMDYHLSKIFSHYEDHWPLERVSISTRLVIFMALVSSYSHSSFWADDTWPDAKFSDYSCERDSKHFRFAYFVFHQHAECRFWVIFLLFFWAVVRFVSFLIAVPTCWCAPHLILWLRIPTNMSLSTRCFVISLSPQNIFVFSSVWARSTFIYICFCFSCNHAYSKAWGHYVNNHSPSCR